MWKVVVFITDWKQVLIVKAPVFYFKMSALSGCDLVPFLLANKIECPHSGAQNLSQFPEVKERNQMPNYALDTYLSSGLTLTDV